MVSLIHGHSRILVVIRTHIRNRLVLRQRLQLNIFIIGASLVEKFIVSTGFTYATVLDEEAK